MVFRRYFCDGNALHKIDIGFSIHLPHDTLPRQQTLSLIDDLLRIRTHSPGFSKISLPLYQAGEFLRHRLLYATTATTEISRSADAIHHLYTCTPALYLELYRKREHLELPRYAKIFTTSGGDEMIAHWFDHDTGVPVFALFHSHRVNNDRVRSLRLLVTRLWAEAECLSAFTAHAASKYFQVIPRSEQSQWVQRYLQSATRNLQCMQRQAFEDDFGSLYSEAQDSLRHLNPGLLEGLLNSLEKLKIRKNLFRNIESTVTQASARTERPTIFISYSHRDAKWMERLQAHLRPLERDGRIESWADNRINAGELWRDKITAAIEKASVALLLISADFFASDFISQNELIPLLESAETKGVQIVCVILSPSRFQRETALSRFQTVNPPNRPLIGMRRHEQEAVFDRVAQTIEESFNRR